MALVTLAQLVAATTREEVSASLLALLKLGGFPTSSWASGSLPKRLTTAFSSLLADALNLMSKVAGAGFVDLAVDLDPEWLTLLARNVYKLDRQAAIFASGPATLTDAAGTGPHTIAIGDLRAASTSGRVFRNTTGGTLPLSGTLDLTWEAENPGAAWNVPVSDLRTLLTPLPGVTLDNPGSGGEWLTAYGADEEDNASLATRCHARWPDLGTGATELVYKGWALSASAEVGRVTVVEDQPSDGRVRIILATASGTAVSGAAVTAAETYVGARRTLCTSPLIESAATVVVPVAATLYVRSAYATTAAAGAATALLNLTASREVGERVDRADIFAAIKSVTGMDNVDLTLPAADTSLAINEVATFPTTFAVVAV